jgi:hypothetical protein
MLRDELKAGIDPVSLKINKAASDCIAQQTAEFERRGGKVNCVPQGASGLDGGVIFIPECKGATPINNTTAALAEKGRKGAAANARLSRSVMHQETNKTHLTVRTNIRKNPNGRYELTISASYYGTFDDLEAAINARQAQREILGMKFIGRDR